MLLSTPAAAHDMPCVPAAVAQATLKNNGLFHVKTFMTEDQGLYSVWARPDSSGFAFMAVFPNGTWCALASYWEILPPT
jgi:hypothetical protein